jgi:hypothetical protein
MPRLGVQVSLKGFRLAVEVQGIDNFFSSRTHPVVAIDSPPSELYQPAIKLLEFLGSVRELVANITVGQKGVYVTLFNDAEVPRHMARDAERTVLCYIPQTRAA